MTRIFRHILSSAAALVLFAAAGVARAQYRMDIPDQGTPTPVENLHIVEKPNAQLPLDLDFTRSDGTPVKLADCFHQGKPVVLSLVYFSCPHLCGINQESILEFARVAPHGIQLAKDYDVLIVSIDPDDTPKEAAIKRKNYLAMVPLPESQPGFTYLTGTLPNIRALADSVGFPFRINDTGSGDKIAHDSGIFVVTADGRLSQTILGKEFLAGLPPDTLHNALRLASNGKIGGGLLGFCISCGAMYFNPKTGQYENNPWFYAGTATGLASIFFMATFLIYLFTGAFWWSLLIGYALGKRKSSMPASPPPPTT